MASAVTREEIAAEMLRLVRLRGAGKSICPSEVARSLAPDGWRPLLSAVRQVAAELALTGDLAILRKGKIVPPAEMRGVIRLGQPAPGNSGT